MPERSHAPAAALALLLAHSASGQSWNQTNYTQIGGFNVDCILHDGLGTIAYNAGASRTWILSGGGWTSHPAAISGRQTPTCVEADGAVYLFGGFDGIYYLGDLWRFERATNSWTSLPPSGNAPTERIYAEAARLDSRILFFGGRDFAQFFNETWTMEDIGGTANWVQHATPAALVGRFAHAMSRGPGDTVVMFGGAANYFGPILGDCWIFDGATHTWTQHLGTVPPPTPGATMHYDPEREIAVLIHQNDETWEWNGFDWRMVPTTASPSWSNPRMAYDPAVGMRAFHVSPNSLTRFDYTPSIANYQLSIAQTCSQPGGQPLELQPFERDLPILGATMDLVATGMLPTSFAVGGVELPTVGPTPFGCGCTLGLSGVNTVGMLMTGTGNARHWALPLPSDPSLSGLQLDVQAIVVEPTISCWLSASQRGTLTLGL